MEKDYGLSDEEFHQLQKRFRTSSSDDRKSVTDELISVLYQDFHDFVQRKSKPASLRTTDVANSFCSKLLKQYMESDSPLNNFTSLDDYMRYNVRCISNFVIDRIRREVKLPVSLNEVSGRHNDDDESGGFDPTLEQSNRASYEPDYIAREAANELMRILDERLNEDDKELLALRYGLNIKMEPQGDGNWEIPEEKEEDAHLKYAEIAKILGDDVTPDAVRMHHNRLIRKLRDTPAIILLAEEYGFQIEPEK